MKNIKLNINVDHNSLQLKFQQIVDLVTAELNASNIPPNQRLPSVNSLSKVTGCSRDTVEKAYRKLKESGLVDSIPGKGFYTKSSQMIKTVVFIVDRVDDEKNLFFKALSSKLGGNYHLNLKIHRGSAENLKGILDRYSNTYDFIILGPLFHPDLSYEESDSCFDLIKKDKIILIDHKYVVTRKFRYLYLDFSSGIVEVLNLISAKIKRYNSITLLSDPTDYRKAGISTGIIKFCLENNKHSRILPAIAGNLIQKMELYIALDDIQLVALMKMITAAGLRIGTDIGIISINDSIYKDLLNIAVISPNLYQLGMDAANLILSSKSKLKHCHLNFIERESF